MREMVKSPAGFLPLSIALKNGRSSPAILQNLLCERQYSSSIDSMYPFADGS